MLKKITLITAILVSLAVVLYSCKKEATRNYGEPVKEIDGTWKITRALRNGTDMTTRFDFSRFRISFADSSYTLSNPVPFLVSGNGNWSFDDPNYPFTMFFRVAGEPGVSSTVQYPVVKGVRNIILSFSPGCVSNTYQYTLEKE